MAENTMTDDATPVPSGILAQLSDAELASTVRMLMRNDLLHEPIVCAARDRIMSLSSTLAAVTAERDALQRFKQYVHKRLDDAGVSIDPESPHKAEGCRIGGRLDLVLRVVAAAQRILKKPNTPIEATDAILSGDRETYRRLTAGEFDEFNAAWDEMEKATAAIAKVKGGAS